MRKFCPGSRKQTRKERAYPIGRRRAASLFRHGEPDPPFAGLGAGSAQEQLISASSHPFHFDIADIISAWQLYFKSPRKDGYAPCLAGIQDFRALVQLAGEEIAPLAAGQIDAPAACSLVEQRGDEQVVPQQELVLAVQDCFVLGVLPEQ